MYFTSENMAKTCFKNLKKRYNKKQNAVKRATRSGAGRDNVSRYENEVKKYAILAWLDKHVLPRESKTNIPEYLENSEKDFGFDDDNSDISSDDGSKSLNGSSQLSTRLRKKVPVRNAYQNNLKRKNVIDLEEDNKAEISTLVKNLNNCFERSDNVPIDNEYHFAISIAGELQNLPLRARYTAKHEIRNILCKHQMNRLDFNENAAIFCNLPIQPYTYSTPTPPPITPGLMSPVGSNMMGLYCQTPTPTPPTVNLQNGSQSRAEQ